MLLLRQPQAKITYGGQKRKKSIIVSNLSHRLLQVNGKMICKSLIFSFLIHQIHTCNIDLMTFQKLSINNITLLKCEQVVYADRPLVYSCLVVFFNFFWDPIYNEVVSFLVPFSLLLFLCDNCLLYGICNGLWFCCDFLLGNPVSLSLCYHQIVQFREVRTIDGFWP